MTLKSLLRRFKIAVKSNQTVTNKTMVNRTYFDSLRHHFNTRFTDNSLRYTHPELSKEWDAKRNGNISPQHVSDASHMKAWWICSENSEHRWMASIKDRAKGKPCPLCHRSLRNPLNEKRV